VSPGVLLVFSDPHCEPCHTLAPRLEEFHREHSEFELVMISRGEPGENRAKAVEHGLTFPVVLQQRWEISRLYAMFATPVAYLIDEAGIIFQDVAVGMQPIESLLYRLAGQPAFA
jgi:peroxiredoxin